MGQMPRVRVYADQLNRHRVPAFGRGTRDLLWDLLDMERDTIVLHVEAGGAVVRVHLRELFPIFIRLIGSPDGR